MLGQAHRGDDRVDGKHQIHHHDGGNGLTKADTTQLLMFLGVLGFLLGQGKHVAKLVDALVDQVCAARQQHQVAHIERMLEKAQVQSEQRLGHVHQIAGEAQEDAARYHGTEQAELTADMLMLGRQSVGGDGDEHDVVHTKDHLQKHQRQQADPSFGRGEDGKIHLHCSFTSFRPIRSAPWCTVRGLPRLLG